jgi:hypothetical protein
MGSLVGQMGNVYKILVGRLQGNKPPGRVRQKVSGLAAWSENCEWYSSLPLGAVISLFCESQSSEFCRHNPLRYFSTSNTKGKLYFVIDSVRKLLDTHS